MTSAGLDAGGVQLVAAGLELRPAVERLQFDAYARNRALLGVEPLPLTADYGEIFQSCEVWITPQVSPDKPIEAAVILDIDRPDDVLIWSVATSPSAQGKGLGAALLQAAEQRARQLRRPNMRLYTGQTLTHLIDWYARSGYDVERTEVLSDRTIVHMLKPLPIEGIPRP